MPEKVVDLSDPETRSKVTRYISGLSGMYRVGITKFRPRRSDRQNKYYWPCFVAPFYEWLREAGYENVRKPDDAHEMLKSLFLPSVEETDKRTGRKIGSHGQSTSTLDMKGFNEYLDRCAQFLAETCEISVPEPEAYHER